MRKSTAPAKLPAGQRCEYPRDMTANGYLKIGATDTGTTDVQRAAAEFARTRGVLCRHALDPWLVERLDGVCDRAEFRSDHVDGLGHRRIEKPAVAGGTIALLLRRRTLFTWLEQVTGCAPIVDVEGRVVQTYAEPGDELVWHDDVGPRRLLAVTVALTSPRHEGGTFELRAVGQEATLRSYAANEPGTVLVFTVSPDYEHRVLPLRAGGPRRIFTGWFLGA